MIPPFEEMKEPKSYLLVLVKVFLFVSACLLTATLYLYFADKNKFAELTKKQKAAIVRSADNYREIPGTSPLDSLQKPVAALVVADSARNKILIDTNAVASDEKLKTSQEVLPQQTIAINPPPVKETKIDNIQKPLPEPVTKTITVTAKDNDAVKPLAVKTVISFKADNIKMTATAGTDFLDKETSKAAETDKFSGSFTVKNTGKEGAVSEVMVVVIQPDGQVMQTSNWENGIFYTSNGKQIYSKKLRFNNSAGEPKKLNFSLQAEKYFPGRYTIEIYHDGNMIGKSFKVLS